MRSTSGSVSERCHVKNQRPTVIRNLKFKGWDLIDKAKDTRTGTGHAVNQDRTFCLSLFGLSTRFQILLSKMKLSANLFILCSLILQASDAFVPSSPTGHPFGVKPALRSQSIAPWTTALESSATPFVPPSNQAATTVAAVPKVAQRWRKSTKQLVTLGPASSTKEMIETLFLAGADLFRLNFSHGSQEQKKELLLAIREIEEKYAHPIGILGDLQGPKLRVRISKPFVLEKLLL